MWLWRRPIAVFNLIEFVVCAIMFLFMALPYGLYFMVIYGNSISGQYTDYVYIPATQVVYAKQTRSLH